MATNNPKPVDDLALTTTTKGQNHVVRLLPAEAGTAATASSRPSSEPPSWLSSEPSLSALQNVVLLSCQCVAIISLLLHLFVLLWNSGDDSILLFFFLLLPIIAVFLHVLDLFFCWYVVVIALLLHLFVFFWNNDNDSILLLPITRITAIVVLFLVIVIFFVCNTS